MDPKKLTRLAALLVLAKAATTAAPLSTELTQELDGLKSEAKTAKVDFNTDDFIAKHTDSSVSETELANLITKAVADAVKGAGIDQTEVVKALKQTLKDEGAKALTAERVEEIVKSHLGGNGIDQVALVAQIKAALPTDAMTTLAFTKALDEFAKSIRTPQRVVHADPYEASFPIEHRSGNLTVGQKQLLNICLANVSKEAKADMKEKGIHVPEEMNEGITTEQMDYARKQGEFAMKRARHSALYGGKALTSTGVGTGDELVPSDLSGELQTRLYLESQIASEFIASEVDMPTNPFTFPMTTTRTAFYTGSENPGSNPANSEPGTGNIILNAAKLIGISDYSYEADEDSIIAILPMLMENMASGAADALEGAIINGDTTATHQDTDIAAVTKHASKLFKGLRKLCLANGATTKLDIAGVITAAKIAAMRKMMGKYGVRPRDLLLIVGPGGYNDIVNLAETLTAEKVGSAAAARILTGEAASIYGIRIVVSSQMREDTDAVNAVNSATPGNNIKGTMLLVHRPSWLMGSRRGFMVEVDVDKKQQVNSVIASFRRDFQPKESLAATRVQAVLGYNITV